VDRGRDAFATFHKHQYLAPLLKARRFELLGVFPAPHLSKASSPDEARLQKRVLTLRAPRRLKHTFFEPVFLCLFNRPLKSILLV
jgi:hypothetical protein